MFNIKNSFNVFYTKDIEITHKFYASLGAVIKRKEDDKVVVQLGGFEIHFILDNTEPFQEYEYITKLIHPGDGVLFYVETNDINLASEKIINAKGNLVKKVFENKWGAWELLFEDNNGFKFALYQMIDS